MHDHYAYSLAIREAVRPPCNVQPWQILHLVTQRYNKTQGGLWYRITELQPRTFQMPYEIPTRRVAVDEAEAMLAAMERGEIEPPGCC